MYKSRMIEFDPQRLKDLLDTRGISVNGLGRYLEEQGVSTTITLRRNMREKRIDPYVLDEIADYLKLPSEALKDRNYYLSIHYRALFNSWYREISFNAKDNYPNAVDDSVFRKFILELGVIDDTELNSLTDEKYLLLKTAVSRTTAEIVSYIKEDSYTTISHPEDDIYI